jgi:hypothetical protein
MRKLLLDPGTRFARVAPDEQVRCGAPVRQRSNERRTQTPDRRVVEGVRAGDAAHSVGAEEPGNRRAAI